MRRWKSTTLLVLLLASGAPGAERAAPSGDWDFVAALDGRPIGRHRFTVTANGDAREVRSVAEFTVKMLGITAYRYRHTASERWQNDCLASITSSTDDDGKVATVEAEKQADGLVVRTGSASRTLKDCVMTFAYWNPALRAQTQLLDPQTGELKSVKIERVASAPIEVRGKPVDATAWRITGVKNPIDVWYAADGQWVGVDSIVAGGRKLTYRLP